MKGAAHGNHKEIPWEEWFMWSKAMWCEGKWDVREVFGKRAGSGQMITKNCSHAILLCNRGSVFTRGLQSDVLPSLVPSSSLHTLLPLATIASRLPAAFLLLFCTCMASSVIVYCATVSFLCSRNIGQARKVWMKPRKGLEIWILILSNPGIDC